MKYSLIVFFMSISFCIFSQENYTSKEIEKIVDTLKKDYVLYETFNKKDTLGIIKKFLDEIGIYVPINDSLQSLLTKDILNNIRNTPGKFTIDDFGYINYRKEVKILTCPIVYKVLNEHFRTLDSFRIMQEIRKKSILIYSYIEHIENIIPLSDEDIQNMPFLKTGWSRDLRYITAYKVFGEDR